MATHGFIVTGTDTGIGKTVFAAGLTRGAPFSYLSLEEARVRMLELYQERGHMFARIDPSVRFSNDRTRADSDGCTDGCSGSDGRHTTPHERRPRCRRCGDGSREEARRGAGWILQA